jgi:hypothetical protein
VQRVAALRPPSARRAIWFAELARNNRQVECAEIGMEHNLGMTCDPIGGLVQIPRIERKAMRAVKAINACRIAMREEGERKVSLDQVIKTMYETGKDMQSRSRKPPLCMAFSCSSCPRNLLPVTFIRPVAFFC